MYGFLVHNVIVVWEESVVLLLGIEMEPHMG